MSTYPSVVAGLRAATPFVGIAWRRAGWALFPACIAWILALSPYHAPAWAGLAVSATLVASAVLYWKDSDKPGQGLGVVVARLLVVWLLTLTFLAVLASLLFVVFLSSAYAVASAGAGFVSSDVRTWAPAIDDRGRAVLAVVGATGLAVLSWAMTRVALGPAATVAQARIQVLSAWPLTRRIGWRLLAARASLALPVGALVALAWWKAVAVSAIAAPAAWLAAICAGAVLAGLWLPLNIGLMTYIYRRRASERSDPTASP